MFKHPGKKIQVLAAVILILHIVGGLAAGMIGGVLVSSAPAALRESGVRVDINTLILLLPVIGAFIGTLIGWINSILLYAFGSLVDDMEGVNDELDTIKLLLLKPRPSNTPPTNTPGE